MNHKLVQGEVIIRDATEDDMFPIAEMVQELANYENMPTAPKITGKELRHDGFGTERRFRCKIAELRTTGTVIGFAVHYPTYSTWEGKAMFLKNLFVKEDYRRCGVGRMLFCAVSMEAVASGCARLDLHVLAWNPARAFYAKVGARDLTQGHGAHCYSLSGKALQTLTSKSSSI